MDFALAKAHGQQKKPQRQSSELAGREQEVSFVDQSTFTAAGATLLEQQAMRTVDAIFSFFKQYSFLERGFNRVEEFC